MAITMNPTARNAALDAIRAAWGASPKLRIYADATPPANAGAALGDAVLLVEFTMGAGLAASAGVLDLVTTTLTAAATGGGTGSDASFYRVYDSTGATCFEQGSVGDTGSGADMTLDNANIATGQTVNVTDWTKTFPHGY